MAPVREISLFAYHRVNLLDVSGPLQVFATAAADAVAMGVAEAPPYRITAWSLDGGPVMTTTGVAIETRAVTDYHPGPDHTLILPGGHGAREAAANPRVKAWVAAQAPRHERVASICTGAFLLAEAGLLDGRRATTHWAWCEELARDFPAVTVETEAIFVEDGMILTGAGVLTGVDLAMALVERDLGRKVAACTARGLVFMARRTGGQPQLSPQLLAQETEVQRLQRLLEWIADNPHADLSNDALANRAHMSVRTLHRHFQAETGVTPAAFVEQARLEAARRMLITTGHPLDRVAERTGFGAAGRMRAAFQRRLGMSPSTYRERFASHGRAVGANPP